KKQAAKSQEPTQEIMEPEIEKPSIDEINISKKNKKSKYQDKTFKLLIQNLLTDNFPKEQEKFTLYIKEQGKINFHLFCQRTRKLDCLKEQENLVRLKDRYSSKHSFTDANVTWDPVPNDCDISESSNSSDNYYLPGKLVNPSEFHKKICKTCIVKQISKPQAIQSPNSRIQKSRTTELSRKSNVIDELLFVFGYRANKMLQANLSELIHSSQCCENPVLPSSDNYEILPQSQLIDYFASNFRNNASIAKQLQVF
ncbi:13397_t:CDS:2, partial [Funneliformis caledonium]